jgi:hypothetical protein
VPSLERAGRGRSKAPAAQSVTNGKNAKTVTGRPNDLQAPLDFAPFSVAAPCCGKAMTVRISRSGAVLCGCFSHGVEGVADALGVPVWKLLDDPARLLAAHAVPGARTATGRSRPEKLPTPAQLAGWEARLWSEPDAIAWLKARGFTDETIRRAGIGYGQFHGRPPAFMLPVRNGIGGLLTLKERYWPELWTDKDGREHKSRTLLGRGSHLCPALGETARVVLCAGEFDALKFGAEIAAAGIEGVEVVSPTSGTAIKDELLEEFVGRSVPVVYDVGEEDAAERTVARLRETGADAWVVPLPLPRRGDDINDWFVYGRSVKGLLSLIRRARRAG